MNEGHRLGSCPRRSDLIEARTGDAVYVVGPDYTIVHWDERMESLSGVLSKDALGKRCYEAVMGVSEGGEPFCAHGCAVMHLAREGRPVSSYEMRIRTRSGTRRWVSASNLTIETDEGPYLVHLLRDTQGTHDALEMARGLIQLSSKEDAPAPRRHDVPALTPRQLEVLKLLSEGNSVREIGKELYLSEATVRNHVRSLLSTGCSLAARCVGQGQGGGPALETGRRPPIRHLPASSC